MSVDIAQLTAHLPPEERQRVIRAYRQNAENETTAYLLCFFLGIFGAHRWYLGHWRSGLLHLIIPALTVLAVIAGLTQIIPAVVAAIIVAILLAIGLGWEIIDLFGIDDEVRGHNRALAERLTAAGALSDDTALNQAVAKLDTLVRDEAAPQAPQAAAGLGVVGSVSAADIASARALADEQAHVTAFDYYSTSDNQIGSTVQQGQQAAQTDTNDWSLTEALPPEEPAPAAGDTTMPYGQIPGAAVAGAALTEDVLSFQHHETEYSTSESLEVDRVALPAEPEPASSDPNDDTWPEMRVPEEAADAATVASIGAFEAGGTDWTDAASSSDHLPIADVEPGPDTVRVNFGDSAAFAADPAATFAATPIPQSVATPHTDYTDAHPHVHHNMPIADIEPGVAKPIYVNLPESEPDEDTTVVLVPDTDAALPGQWDTSSDTYGWGAAAGAGAPSWEDTQPIPPSTYVPPTVPVTTSQEGQGGETLADIAGAGAAAAMFAGDAAPAAAEPPTWPVEPAPPVWPTEPSQAAEPAASSSPVEAAPPTPQRMKRVRVVRRLVVDGEVVSEQVVEEIVPVDTDTAATAEQLRESLGHATPEQIAQMAHLDPNAPLEVRQKNEMPGAEGTQQ